jgi:AraC family transcriptional regulator
MQRASSLGPLDAVALTNRLTLLILQHYSTRPVVHKLLKPRLTHTQLEILDAYIYAHLKQKITLADLATCLHLSVPHFERMFRTTTHIPPYRYVLEVRLEQARCLLEKTHLPVAEVALQYAFSSHCTAHFTALSVSFLRVLCAASASIFR